MQNVGIFFGSSTGNTQDVAGRIAQLIGKQRTKLYDVEKSTAADIDKYNNLIFGSSTWGIGEMQDDFKAFLPELQNAQLAGKVVALFALGDSGTYPDSFVDSLGVLYNALKNKGCHITGHVPTSGYEFEASKGIKNGRFVGLPIDEDSQADLTGQRIENWVQQIVKEFV